MIFRKFYINIIIRVILLSGNSLFLAWYFVNSGLDITLIFTFSVFVFQTINLIAYNNRTNRLLTFFFDAVRNEDSTLVFDEKSGNISFDKLSGALNVLNRKLQKARIDIEVQEKYYKAIVESAATALIVYDSEGGIHLSNTALNQLLGLQQLHNINQVKRKCLKLFDLLQDINDGESLTINTSINNIPRYLQVSAESLLLQGRNVRIAAIQDISYELDQQEIESWQKLIRILNHEIMNSVAPITSLSATLTGFFKKGEKVVKPEDLETKTLENTLRGLSVIEDHSKGLISFVNSYRSLTKLPRPEPKDFMVSELFESVSILASSLVDSMADTKGKGFTISSQAYPPDLSLYADQELLTRVVHNLVKNGLEAFESFENSAIFLEAGKNSSGKVWIRIIDNGPGIPDELVSNIFVPFFTTKEGGSGIGLSLSRQIVSMHKGTIRIFSNPGEGTTVLIQL